MKRGDWPTNLGLNFENTFIVNGAEVPGVVLDNGETVHPMTSEAVDALRRRGVGPSGKRNPYNKFLLRQDNSLASIVRNAVVRQRIKDRVLIMDDNPHSCTLPARAKPRWRFFS